MKADCLSPDEAWELFQKIVGETPLKRHEDIPILARKVVEKCCGLPLALNVIGKAMEYKEWHHRLMFLTRLATSFQKELLIEYWICEGFITGNNQGQAIICSLVRAHLLMDVEFKEKVKMHDVLRERALWIAFKFEKQKNKLYVKSGVQLCCIPNDINWKVVRRISLMSNQVKEISCCNNCPKLSTLLLRNNRLVDMSGEFFQFMPAIIILDLLGNKNLCGLPEEISSLSSLQYLGLSSTGIRSLPSGLKGLRKLINLDLEFTYFLKNITGIGTSLPYLQVLKILGSNVSIDARLMEELNLLKHLKILKANVENASVLKSIQGVEQLANSI